jgi:hypothetical protein
MVHQVVLYFVIVKLQLSTTVINLNNCERFQLSHHTFIVTTLEPRQNRVQRKYGILIGI